MTSVVGRVTAHVVRGEHRREPLGDAAPARRVERFEDIGPAFDAAERTKGPFLIDFRIDPEANVYPIVPLGKSLNEFWESPENA